MGAKDFFSPLGRSEAYGSLRAAGAGSEPTVKGQGDV